MDPPFNPSRLKVLSWRDDHRDKAQNLVLIKSVFRVLATLKQRRKKQAEQILARTFFKFNYSCLRRRKRAACVVQRLFKFILFRNKPRKFLAARCLQRFVHPLLGKRRIRKLRHLILTRQKEHIMQCLLPPTTQPRPCSVGSHVLIRDRDVDSNQGIVTKYAIGESRATIRLLSGAGTKNIQVSDLIVIPAGVNEVSPVLAVSFDDLVDNDTAVLDRCEASMALSTRVLKRRVKILHTMMLELVDIWGQKIPASSCFTTVFEEQSKLLANKISSEQQRQKRHRLRLNGVVRRPKVSTGTPEGKTMPARLTNSSRSSSSSISFDALIAINQHGSGFSIETFERRIAYWEVEWATPPANPCAICCDYMLCGEYATAKTMHVSVHASLIGCKVNVTWSAGKSYQGTFDRIDEEGKFVVVYNDGDERSYHLSTDEHGVMTAINRNSKTDIHTFVVKNPSSQSLQGISNDTIKSQRQQCKTGDFACQNCLREYARVAMVEATPIFGGIQCFCGCKAVMPDYAITALFRSDADLQKEHTVLVRKLRHRRIAAHPHLRFCPNPKCTDMKSPSRNRTELYDFEVAKDAVMQHKAAKSKQTFFRCVEKNGVCYRNSAVMSDRDSGEAGVAYGERIAGTFVSQIRELRILDMSPKFEQWFVVKLDDSTVKYLPMRKVKKDCSGAVECNVVAEIAVGDKTLKKRNIEIAAADIDIDEKKTKVLLLRQKNVSIPMFQKISAEEMYSPRLVVNEVAVVDLSIGSACWRCNEKLCPSCGAAEHKKSQGETKNGQGGGGGCAALHDFKLMGLLESKKDWVRCPKSQHVIERTAGCDHMTCRCGAEFCFKVSFFTCGTIPTCMYITPT